MFSILANNQDHCTPGHCNNGWSFEVGQEFLSCVDQEIYLILTADVVGELRVVTGTSRLVQEVKVHGITTLCLTRLQVLYQSFYLIRSSKNTILKINAEVLCTIVQLKKISCLPWYIFFFPKRSSVNMTTYLGWLTNGSAHCENFRNSCFK